MIRQHVERLAGERGRRDPVSLRLSESIFLELVLLLMRHRYAPDKLASRPSDIDLVIASLGSRLNEI